MVEALKSIGPVDGDENMDAGLDLPISEGLNGINPKWKDQSWSAYAYYKSAEEWCCARRRLRRGRSTSEWMLI